MSKKETSQMTHIQLVNENKPKSVFYRGTESKKLPRVCSQCGITVNGKLTDLEQHWSENHTVVVGFDYTNQAWIKDGVYVDCGHPDIGQLVDPGQPGGPDWHPEQEQVGWTGEQPGAAGRASHYSFSPRLTKRG